MDNYLIGEFLLIIGIIISLAAQIYVNVSYKKYKNIENSKGLTGFDVARKILDENGLKDIDVTEVRGNLTDHYDPVRKVIRLSTDIFHGKTIASSSVAAHEVGHAIQDKEGYSFMRFRSMMFPLVRFSSYGGYIAILVGALFGLMDLIWFGIGLEIVILLFQIITLPVEFNASSRAKDELAKYNPNVKNISLNQYVGEDFDTIEDKLFIKAYVPFVPERRQVSKVEKRNKKIEQFDRMVKGEFSFHYDTQMFARCINLFKPTDKVVISNKLHGTSLICGKLHVKTPIKIPFYKWIWNKFVDLTGLFKSLRITDYVVEYGNVTSSRTVIKNQYINKKVTGGYYGVDIWSEYGDLIYPFLDEGMTVYGEICGYISNSQKMIQKGYDYGCDKGENFLMIYRITTTNEDGSKKEWNVQDVYNWTKKLITEHTELEKRIRPITIFYHGTLRDLYPDLSLMEHWHENVLEAMRNDKEHFGMEKKEPLCRNSVWREGIVIRKDDDDLAEAFKLKCMHFLKAEAVLMDDIANGKEEVSEEMAEVYG